MKPINVGLLGFGTVGRGTWDVLRRNQEEIQRRAGRPIVVSWIATRTLDRAREATRGIAGVNLTNDPAVVRPPSRRRHRLRTDRRHRARATARARRDRARQARRHCEQGAACAPRHRDLRRRAREGVMVGFEAAVAGGIPIIKALREGLTANRIEWIAGIINARRTSFFPKCAPGCVRSARCSPRRRHRVRGSRTRRSTSRHRCRAQADDHGRRSPSACRCSSTRRTPRASPG